MGRHGATRTRRDVIKGALAGTAYIAPSMISAGLPTAVSAATPPPALSADLGITIAADNAALALGARVTLSLTITNAGPATATGVAVAARLPSTLTFISATPSQGTYDPATGVWSVGVLALMSATLRIVATANATATATATITHSDQLDPNPANNSASVTIVPAPGPQADLALTKVVDNTRPNVGDTVIFTVAVRNNGPDDAATVQVSDLLPAGLTFIAATPAQGAYDSATGIWAVGTLATGAATLLAISATVATAGAKTNTATITRGAPADPIAANNSASTTVTPKQADLALTKALINATPLPRNTTVFLMTLTNNGPDAATNVAMADTVPAGTSLVSATPSQGTYNGAAGRWSVGTLAAGIGATLRLTVALTGPAPVTNQATVAHSDQFDPVAGNNAATATASPGLVNLLFDEPFDVTPVPQPHSSRVNVFNFGANSATNLVVRVSVNAPYTISNPTAPAGTTVAATADPRAVLWNIPLLPAGIFIPDLTFNAAGPAGTLTVTQTAIAVDQFDAGAGSDSVTVSAL